MAAFRHSLQLRQLQRLDPAAHKAATIALRGGFISMATRIVIEAMRAAFDRLTKPQPIPNHPTKTQTKKSRCDAYRRDPDGEGLALIRCRKIARFRLTLVSGGEPYDLLRCPDCRADLHTSLKNGSIFEILSDEALPENYTTYLARSGQARRGQVGLGTVGLGGARCGLARQEVGAGDLSAPTRPQSISEGVR